MYPIVPLNINKGLVCLLFNGVAMMAVSLMSPPNEKSIAKLMLTQRSM